MRSTPELLAPAGNLEKLKIAVLYGANAVYLGGQQFSLRAGSENFTQAEVQEGVAFAHAHGAKAYVVLNGFLHDEDFEGLPDYVRFLEHTGVDAVIVSDLGVIEAVREHSRLPVHLSTQASCLNLYSARLWKALGVKRLILGREVSIAQAGTIRREVGLEVELFIHGAMCMAYSGHCTLSNYTAGRDSNRGGCVQSCRFEYKVYRAEEEQEALPPAKPTVTLMSSKDLRGLELLPQFIEAGIDSVKIEGRMKTNLYVATAVRAYAQGLKLCQGQELSSPALASLSEDIKRMAHRDYTEASLMAPADEASLYRGNRSEKSNTDYELAGTVVEVCPPNHLTLFVQNPFDQSATLEFLTFAGETLAIPAAQMTDVERRPLTQAKPNSLVLLPFKAQVSQLTLARKRM